MHGSLSLRDSRPAGIVGREATIQWCHNLVELLKDGDRWAIPRSSLVFRVNKKDKALTLVSGSKSDPNVTATREAFSPIGWKVQA